MLKNNRVAFVLALLMAIALWAYVLGEVDPVRTVTIRNIPIRLVDQSALENNGLVITDMDHEDITVTFTAKRSLVTKIDAGDFHATADLRDIKLGNNVIMIELTSPSNINLESVSPEYVNITTDQYVTVEKGIEVRITNPTKDDTEPTILNVSDSTVGVSGAASDVGKVAKVIAELDAGRMGHEPQSISAELKPVDENGNIVDDVSLEFSNVTITAVMKSTRTVPLEVTVTGLEGGSVYRSYTAPDSIMIKGDDDLINSIESIECEPLDLTDCYENAEIALTPILPDGVELISEAEDLTVKVTVINAETMVFDFNETDIDVTGVGTGRSVKIENLNIKVTVKGISTVIQALTKDNFSLSADISDLDVGTHSVELKVMCGIEGVDSIKCDPEKIDITIENLEENSEESNGEDKGEDQE